MMASRTSAAEAARVFPCASRHGLSRALPDQGQNLDQRQGRRTGVSDPHNQNPGLKPAWIMELYAALKRRSSTVLHASR